MTLSIPDGLIRALRENRLPSKVEVWHSEREEWVSLAAHPAARQALESIGSYLPASGDPQPDEPEVEPAEVPEPASDPVLEAEPVLDSEMALEVEPEPEPPEPDSLDVLLAAAHEFIPPPSDLPEPEVEAVVPIPPPPPPEPPPARSSRLDITPPPRQLSPATERKRTAAPVDSPSKVEPVSAAKPRFTLPFKLPSRRVLIGGVALVIAVGYFLKSRSAGDAKQGAAPTVATQPSHPQTSGVPARESVVEEELPPLPVDSSDTALTPGALELQGLPSTPESDLETRLRLADALMWNPAEDFGSPGNVLRARRKVDAVRNSIQAYRVDMRRLDQSGPASRQGNRLEPFDEASRIDDVVSAMGAAIEVLEDVSGRFSVRGGTLEFDRAEDARRYNVLRDRADSLLQAPVEMDPRPIFRPPRRLVTRLIITLPGGMARGASGP